MILLAGRDFAHHSVMTDLCEALASTAKRICSFVDPECIPCFGSAISAFNSINRENALKHSIFMPFHLNCLINVNLFIDAPLIHHLSTNVIKQVWYGDDASACGKLSENRLWWEHLVEIGPQYGYFPNASKTWMKGSNIWEQHLGLRPSLRTLFLRNWNGQKRLKCSLPSQLVNLTPPMHAILMGCPASGPFSAGQFQIKVNFFVHWKLLSGTNFSLP